MATFKDMTGEKCGRLTVIEKCENIRKRVAWLCKCDCGEMTKVTGNDLRTGNTKSCGCIYRESRGLNALDLTGQRFTRLVVESRAGTNRHDKAIWKCRCDCGNLTEVISSHLNNGNTKSCGCLSREIANQQAEDLTGMQFGKWTVKERADNIDDRVAWICECDCGRRGEVLSKQLKSGRSVRCPQCSRDHLSQTSSDDLAGQKFGNLLVIERAESIQRSNGKKRTAWLVRCECGQEKVIPSASLKSKKYEKCYCKHAERGIWHNMVRRCDPVRAAEYPRYAGRGIRACRGFQGEGGFITFLMTVGKRPRFEYQLDRTDNDAHYSCGKCHECIENGWPLNCRWVTKRQNANNRENSRVLQLGEHEITMAEFQQVCDYSYSHIMTLLAREFSPEAILERKGVSLASAIAHFDENPPVRSL